MKRQLVIVMAVKHNTLATLGARSIAKEEREEKDFYATDPKVVEDLLKVIKLTKEVIEPNVGMGHIASVLEKHGHKVTGFDIVDRGYHNTQIIDFLKHNKTITCDVVMNPPYSQAQEHVAHALKLLADGYHLCAFLKVQFLETKSRLQLFKNYKPKKIYIYSYRQRCAKNGDFEKAKGANAICYCWFIWEKGNSRNAPKLYWINEKE